MVLGSILGSKGFRTLAACCALVLGFSALTAQAQNPVRVQKAELAINFGVAKGELITANDLLIFVDQEVADGAFLLEKSNISGWTEQDGVINITTVRPVKDRNGERTRFAFRLLEGNSANLAMWYRDPANMRSTMTSGTTGTPTSTDTLGVTGTRPTDAAKPEYVQKVYQVRKKNFPIGSTDGRLVIGEKMLAFEANGNTKHSRQWELKDIKKLDQTGPYRLKIESFSGDDYSLEMLGEGMTPADFKALSDRVAAARLIK